MQQTKALSIKKESVLTLARFTLLMGIALFVPLFHNQAVTGPIVNAVLFISAISLGIEGAVLIALVPSLVALSAGLLPPVMAPVVPFIMMSNIILVVFFIYLKEKNYWLAIVLASVLKFVFLFSASGIVIDLLIKKEIAAKVAVMMSWPQLFTALAGGLIAYLFLKCQRKSTKIQP